MSLNSLLFHFYRSMDTHNFKEEIQYSEEHKKVFNNFRYRMTGLYYVYNFIISQISASRGDKILDIGCGNGKLLRSLYEKFGNEVQLYGIDHTVSIIRSAHELNSDLPIKFKIANIEDIPYMDGTFDWVICTFVAHHMTTDGKAAIIQQARRVLKRGGKLIITDLGMPRHIWSRIFASINRFRCSMYAKNNMEIVEHYIHEKNMKIILKKTQFGLIDHIIAERVY